MNFISKLISKASGAVDKEDFKNLSTKEKAKYIVRKGKFIEKRISGEQCLALYLLDETFFEILSNIKDKEIFKVMEINNSSMERFYGRESLKGQMPVFRAGNK